MNNVARGAETVEIRRQIGQLWIIPGPTYGFCIGYYKTPNWFHRLMMKLLLGWTFVPDKP